MRWPRLPVMSRCKPWKGDGHTPANRFSWRKLALAANKNYGLLSFGLPGRDVRALQINRRSRMRRGDICMNEPACRCMKSENAGQAEVFVKLSEVQDGVPPLWSGFSVKVRTELQPEKADLSERAKTIAAVMLTACGNSFFVCLSSLPFCLSPLALPLRLKSEFRRRLSNAPCGRNSSMAHKVATTFAATQAQPVTSTPTRHTSPSSKIVSSSMYTQRRSSARPFTGHASASHSSPMPMSH